MFLLNSRESFLNQITFTTLWTDIRSKVFNLLVIPCVSPWGYEVIERWNAKAVDPNRSFNPNKKGGDEEEDADSWFKPEPATQESLAVIGYLEKLNIDQWMCHFGMQELR